MSKGVIRTTLTISPNHQVAQILQNSAVLKPAKNKLPRRQVGLSDVLNTAARARKRNTVCGWLKACSPLAKRFTNQPDKSASVVLPIPIPSEAATSETFAAPANAGVVTLARNAPSRMPGQTR